MTQDNLELTWDDIAELVRVNALAAEQLKNIAMRRRMADLEKRLTAPPEHSTGSVAESEDSA